MLEGSFWELALIFVLALVVFGPERLPGLARTVGLWMGRARAVVRNLTEQIERELAAEEMRKAANSVRQAVYDPTNLAEVKSDAPGTPQGTVKHDPPAG
ncbi:MAG: Sec-independent protein translocase protein TatB [Gammaproteobacteria bacterium]